MFYRADDILSDVTVFVLDCGEPSVAKCKAHLLNQNTLFYCHFIFNKRPIGAAFSYMPALCATKYYVQVDADMILNPHTIRYLYARIIRTSEKTAFFCGWLWGDAEQQPIQGVKIFRKSVIDKVPYGDDYTYDFVFNQKLKDAGYEIVIDDKPEDEDGCLGLHWSLQTTLMAYRRWHRMTRKMIEFPEHYGYIKGIIPKLESRAAALGARDAIAGRPVECAEKALIEAGL